MRPLGRLQVRPPYWPGSGYLVGGAVRDLWLGFRPQDYDFLVEDPEDEAKRAAAARGGRPIRLKGGVFRVVTRDLVLDFVPLPREGPKADLLRRDYTVNALWMNRRGVVFGLPVARVDLEKRRLRALGPHVFRADPLRSLRGIRLWTTRGLRPEPRTWEWVRAHAHELRFAKRPAAERVQEELGKILASPRAAFGLWAMERSDLLAAYLPELAAGVGLWQGGYHHADLWRHTLETLAFLIHRHPEADLALRLAALFHDVAKPLVRQWDERRGYYRFFFHDEDSAALARAILHRLRFKKTTIHRVQSLIEHHMKRPPLRGARLRRWVFEHRARLPDLLWLQVADLAATRGPKSRPDAWRALAGLAPEVHRILAELPSRPLLSGREVAALLRRPPGPWLGPLLKALLAAQAEGRVTSQEEAKVFVLWWYEAQASHPGHPTDR